MEGGRGNNRQVILVSTELFRFRRVWEGLGVELRVAKHLFELAVVEMAVDRGVDVILGWGGPVVPMGGHERRHRLRVEGPLVWQLGWTDLWEGGITGGQWGPWGELWGLW